jgi:hypothetical protein
MTSKVRIEPAGHHVLVSIADWYKNPAGLRRSAYEQLVLRPGDPPLELYATTSRIIEVVDLEPDDTRTGAPVNSPIGLPNVPD